VQEEFTKALYEKLLIQYMFNNERVREKLVPFLDSSVFFYQMNSQVIESILGFMKSHDHFPRINEMKLYIKSNELYDHLMEIMNTDSSEYDEEFILGELEEFYRKSLISKVIIESREKLNKDSNEMQDLPDELLNALSFTFDTNIGTSLIDDEDKFFEALHNKDNFIPTNIRTLDRLIDGGCHEKTLNGILAGTGVGKSLALCSLACNFLLQNKNVLYITLEMSEQKIQERILANLFDIEISSLKNLSRNQYKEYYKALKNRIKANLHIVEYPEKTISANRIDAIVKEFQTKKNVKFDVAMIDYLALMCTNTKMRDVNSYHELGLISQELRGCAKKHSFPIWSAFQTNRMGLNKVDAEIDTIADSAKILHTLDLLFALTSSDELREAGKYKASILKNRYGTPNFSFYVGVDYPKMRIFDLEDELSKQEIYKPKSVVDEAAVEVLKTMQSNVNEKRKRITGIE
jgi:archaellum biogenesis ATPase FlaH